MSIVSRSSGQARVGSSSGSPSSATAAWRTNLTGPSAPARWGLDRAPPPALGAVAAAGGAAAVGEAHVGAQLAVLELGGPAGRRRAGGGRERARAQRPLGVHRAEAVVAPGDVVER